MEKPTVEHLNTVKHLLRYIAGTSTFGLCYKRATGEARLLGFSDSDHAGDIDDRKSTSGGIFFLGTSPISWQSMKQRIVAISSCEAEYVAATTAACQGLWLARLLGDLKEKEASSFVLKIDNQSAISLCKNPVFHDRSKHIEVRYHFIRECVEKKQVTVEHLRTEEQLADILTKALARVRFQELRAKIGVAEIK
jgi:hypothetical protein